MDLLQVAFQFLISANHTEMLRKLTRNYVKLCSWRWYSKIIHLPIFGLQNLLRRSSIKIIQKSKVECDRYVPKTKVAQTKLICLGWPVSCTFSTSAADSFVLQPHAHHPSVARSNLCVVGAELESSCLVMESLPKPKPESLALVHTHPCSNKVWQWLTR